MSDFDINNYLTKNYLVILEELNNKNKFLNFINYINTNFKKIKISKLELLIKIILNKILYYEGNLKNKEFKKFYDNIDDEENKELLDNFIDYYDISSNKSLCSIVDDSTGTVRRIRKLINDQ